ncbi:MAG: hypothetical protein GEU99_04180 [Luteitalea sp.]|nr:hypothetical protein [Luteitalea sp.]
MERTAGILASARAFWTLGQPVERTCYAIGALLVVSGLVHLAILVVTGSTWEGPVSLRKPLTFGVSFGLTLITMSWVSSFLRMTDRTRRILLGAFAVACVVEVALITLQAWRGVPSHLNMSTSLDGLVARVLAAGGVVLVAFVLAMTAAAFRENAQLEPGMRLALRAGFVGLIVAEAAGGAMIALGVRQVIAGHQQAAYFIATSLKPAHAVTMHAILVLPLLDWLLTFTRLDARRRFRAVLAVTLTYGLAAAGVIAASIVATF